MRLYKFEDDINANPYGNLRLIRNPYLYEITKSKNP